MPANSLGDDGFLLRVADGYIVAISHLSDDDGNGRSGSVDSRELTPRGPTCRSLPRKGHGVSRARSRWPERSELDVPGSVPLLTSRPKGSHFRRKAHTECCLCYNEGAEGSRTPPLSHLANGQGNEMEAMQW